MDEMLLPIITAILGSGLINCILTHFLHSNKLRKEVEIKNNSMIAEKVAESLEYFRDMELMLTTFEIYDVDNVLKEKGAKVDVIDMNCAFYPAVFTDKKSLVEFINKIRECRSKHEKYLSCRLALNVVFIERYMMKVLLFAKDYTGENILPTIGAFLVVDLQKWQRRIDKILVREINKATFKLESHETEKWRLLRKWELEGKWKNTLLYYLIEGKCAKYNRKKMEFAKEMFEKAMSGN